MKLARAAVSGEGQADGEAGGEEGLPVTVAATKMDGYVLSLTPFTHSYNYRSAVLFGYATLVEDQEEKLWGELFRCWFSSAAALLRTWGMSKGEDC